VFIAAVLGDLTGSSLVFILVLVVVIGFHLYTREIRPPRC
jgi:hypothetical protein